MPAGWASTARRVGPSTSAGPPLKLDGVRSGVPSAATAPRCPPSHTLLDGFDLEIANQDRDALLQKIDRHQQAVFAAAGDDDAFQAHQRTRLHADALPGHQ